MRVQLGKDLMNKHDTVPPRPGARLPGNWLELPQKFFYARVADACKLVLGWINRSAINSAWLTAGLSTVSLVYLGAERWLSEVPQLVFDVGGRALDIAFTPHSMMNSNDEQSRHLAHVWLSQTGTVILIMLACWSCIILGTYLVCRSTESTPRIAGRRDNIAKAWHRMAIGLWCITVWVVFGLIPSLGLAFLSDDWEPLGAITRTITTSIVVSSPAALLIGLVGTHIWRSAGSDDATVHDGAWQQRRLVMTSVFLTTVPAVAAITMFLLVRDRPIDPTQSDILSVVLPSLLWYVIVALLYLATIWNGLWRLLEVGVKLLILVCFGVGLLHLVGEYFRDIVFPSPSDECVTQDSLECQYELCALRNFWSEEYEAIQCIDRYRYVYFFQVAAVAYLARQVTKAIAWIVRADYCIQRNAKLRNVRTREGERNISDSLGKVNRALRRISFHTSMRSSLNGERSPFRAHADSAHLHETMTH